MPEFDLVIRDGMILDGTPDAALSRRCRNQGRAYRENRLAPWK